MFCEAAGLSSAEQAKKLTESQIIRHKMIATSAVLIHKFKQFKLAPRQQSCMHKNYYRHFIKIYETNIRKSATADARGREWMGVGGMRNWRIIKIAWVVIFCRVQAEFIHSFL